MGASELRLTKEEFNKLRAIGNYILVKPNFNTDKVKLKSGEELWIDTSYEREKHAATTGTVIRVPERLYFSYNNGGQSVDFDVDMELKEGDKVYFHYLSCLNALKDCRYVVYEDEYYLWIKYDSMYVGKRGEDIVMLNGWMLMEPINIDSFKSETLYVPETSKNTSSSKYARIKYFGKPVRNYLRNKNITEVNLKVEKGDVVMFDPHSDIPLQYDLHADLEGSNKFFRMQRKDITGILKGTEEEIMEIIKSNN